jgi:histidinol-phosphatase (PHP family)
VMIDYHMHLAPDGDPLTDGREFTVDHISGYVAAAIVRGVDEIAFTEHLHRFRIAADLFDHPWWRQSAVADLDAYRVAIAAAAAAGLPVLAGIELDWFAGRVAELRVIADRNWDVVLGSVHWLDVLAVDHPDYPVWDLYPIDEVWRRYTDELCAAAASGLYDVMAHPDLAKVFGARPSRALQTTLNAQIAEAFAEAGVCAEISTAGLRKPCAELYPSPDLLDRLSIAGVPITIASDAHTADDVGRDFDRAIAAAHAAGYRWLQRFKGRDREAISLG